MCPCGRFSYITDPFRIFRHAIKRDVRALWRCLRSSRFTSFTYHASHAPCEGWHQQNYHAPNSSHHHHLQTYILLRPWRGPLRKRARSRRSMMAERATSPRAPAEDENKSKGGARRQHAPCTSGLASAPAGKAICWRLVLLLVAFVPCCVGTNATTDGTNATGSPASSPPMCTDGPGCGYTGDGDCDDGGPGAEFASCSLGTDCTDCGPRVMPLAPPPQPPHQPSVCSDGPGCTFTSDGWCDDGGPGAAFTHCPLGTDCTDCGPRPVGCFDNAVTGFSCRLRYIRILVVLY